MVISSFLIKKVFLQMSQPQVHIRQYSMQSQCTNFNIDLTSLNRLECLLFFFLNKKVFCTKKVFSSYQQLILIKQCDKTIPKINSSEQTSILTLIKKRNQVPQASRMTIDGMIFAIINLSINHKIYLYQRALNKGRYAIQFDHTKLQGNTYLLQDLQGHFKRHVQFPILFTYIQMSIKIFFLLGLVLLAQAYTEENHVLILTDEDLPGVISEFPYILIEFYAPWCGHCKRLTPIYDQVAKELHDAGSPVRLAKIDADQYSSVKGGYGVQGFPTLLFYSNGQQIKYSGQRTKEVMVSWLTKKTRPAVTVIEASQLSDLSNDKVNLVLYTDDSAEHDKLFEELAIADDYNNYYSVKRSEQPAGTVQIFRPFGEVQTTTVSNDLKQWIGKFERPTVYPFDDRTIGSIFGERGVGVILFHSSEAGEALAQAFSDAANEIRVVQDKSSLIFTDIQTNAEHYKGLANYIKILTEKSPIVIIDGGSRIKFILEASPADVTSQQIVSFVENYQNGSLKQYKMDEEVTYSDNTKVEDEL